MAYLDDARLAAIGFASLGRDVRVSDAARIYNPGRIALGDHVRIDDYCILSAGDGGIRIGSRVHIACYCSLIGSAEIVLEDFAGLSSRVSVYSASDDYSGACLTNPTVPDELRRVDAAPVRLCKHVIVGAGSVILPGVTVEQGAAVGALTLVTKSLPAFGVYLGVPARRVAARKRDLLGLEESLYRRERAAEE